MSNEVAIAALARYNRSRSEAKKDAVRAAVARLAEDPDHTINKSVVARHAGVSREFINTHHELKALIDAAARRARNGTSPDAKPAQTVDAELGGLRAQNRTFADTIARQKATITELRSTIEQLRHQRKLHLGAQLAATVVDPDAHRRLQLDHDRLAADKRQLQVRVDELERTVNSLRDDLAASRRAHAEDLAQHAPNTRQSAAVIPFSGDHPRPFRWEGDR
jgi:chromosome segregation ATPase